MNYLPVIFWPSLALLCALAAFRPLTDRKLLKLSLVLQGVSAAAAISAAVCAAGTHQTLGL